MKNLVFCKILHFSIYLLKKMCIINKKYLFSEGDMKKLYLLTAVLAISACVSKNKQPQYDAYVDPQVAYNQYTTTVPTQIIYDYEDYNPQNEVITHEIIMPEGGSAIESTQTMEYAHQTTYVTSATQPMYVPAVQQEIVYVEQPMATIPTYSPTPEVVVSENPLLPSQKPNLKNVKTVNHRRPRNTRIQNFYPTVGGPAPMPQTTLQPVNQSTSAPAPQPAGPEYLLK